MGASITSIFTSIFLFLIVTGFLFGFIKGMARSIFSLILVVACFVIILITKGNIVNFITHMNVGGQSLHDALTSALSQTEGMAGLVDKLVPLIEIILGIVAFIVGFIALYLVSRIIYFIVKFFIRPNKKRRLLGALFGVVQGLVMAFVICVPINGVLLEVNKLSKVEVNGEQILSLESLGFDEYEESPICNVLSSVGGGVFKSIASTTTDDGRVLTLSGQIDSVVTVVKIAEQVTKLPEVNFEEGLTTESVQGVTDILRSLEEIKSESSEEVLETVDELISSAVDMFGEEIQIDIDLSQLSVKEINFENEAVLVETVYELAENESLDNVEDLDAVIEAFANSTLVLPVVELALEDTEINLPEDVKEELITSIDKLEDEEQIQRLKELFNLLPQDMIPQA
ncbi:MAG: CvpA family protein [Clostridia bacterium]|nr:CvpA family protein [Clostridia bacterium]